MVRKMVDTDMSGSIERTNSHFIGAPSWPLRYAPSFKLDEGYSEETRSQGENDVVMRSDSRYDDVAEIQNIPLPEWLLQMNETDRCEFTYAILRTLRTSSIASIVDRLNPLLHIDPVGYLPPEIMAEILVYLEPGELLKASALSKQWRARALDSQIWRHMFRFEGWTANVAAAREYEDNERAKRRSAREANIRRSRARRAEGSIGSERPMHKKRLNALSSRESRIETQQYFSAEWAEQHGPVEADESPSGSQSDSMQGVAFHNRSPIPMNNDMDYSRETARFARADGRLDATMAFVDRDHGKSGPEITQPTLEPPLKPQLLLNGVGDNPKINWHYLYKQKLRLEENWNATRYTNFQLPHPKHQSEAHTECVYTIQFSGKYLVSGSRDKSVRIWNLDTQRLARPPLMGHNLSVLCLQFDASPSQDIIVSGGSDQHVLIWKFSTGEIIKKIENAHTESILNLRFDDKYLVTCSKDKTIKVWNRKEIVPSDATYPRRSAQTSSDVKFPSYIINVREAIEDQHLHYQPLAEYSLLMTIEGHSAAVNAIQIYGGEIVSASGDRKIKVWDINTGEMLKRIEGHNKGIACVQYDGRRIVSGSSDETVRIFDPATSAEVACLSGHSNLVRTVQATFGDLPGNEAELEAEAKEVDAQFFKARDEGLLDADQSRDRRRARNAGSRDPKDIFAYGAKLPPGGGGSRWARIVSGSYDESVIIWRKDPETGKWVIGKVLLQHEAVRAAGGLPRRIGPPHPHHVAAHAHAMHPQVPHQPNVPTQAAAGTHAGPGSQQSTANQLAAVQANFQALAAQANAQVAHAQMLAQQAQALQAQTQQVQAQQAAIDANQQQQLAAAAAQVQAGVQNVQAAQGAAMANLAHAQQGAAVNAQAGLPTAAQAPPVSQPTHGHPHGQAQAHPQTQQHQQQQQQHHHHLPPHHPMAAHHQASTNSRVFKLQFDARRIICCSQDPTIVGWDFANGDKDIEAASQFFGEML